MTLSRRTFLQRSSTAAALTAVGARAAYAAPRRIDAARAADVQARNAARADVARMERLALRAVDAARRAGAQFADARLTRTLQQPLGMTMLNLWPGDGSLEDVERAAIGVRAFVDGCWGFAASPYWTDDDADRLGREAAAQARTNASIGTKRADLGHYPVVTGTWTMPVKIDPFTVPLEEKVDVASSWLQAIKQYGPWIDPTVAKMMFYRQERTVANTEGSLFTQTTYKSKASFVLPIHRSNLRDKGQIDLPIRGMGLSGAGWELCLDADVYGQLPVLIDEANALFGIPGKPVEIGRSDVVFDAETTAALLDATIAPATQLDRALGFEANAAGTSYLGPDPMALLGTFAVGSPLLNVTADRSALKGLATVKWDDEGVEPQPFTLVKNGTLTDYQTTREQAGWLAPYYQKAGMPVGSRGCAGAESARGITMQQIPNITMVPATTNASFNDLVASTKRGLAIVRGDAESDFQLRTGMVHGFTREIVDGRLGAYVHGSACIFNAVDLWKNLIAVGGTSSAESAGFERTKGQPAQSAAYSISAPAISIKNLAVVEKDQV